MEMEKDPRQTDARLARYMIDAFRPADAALEEVKERARAAGLPMIQVGAMDGLHLEVLARLSGARKAVEIGTLAGYSGLCLLRGMGEDGRLWTFEADPKHADVAQETFRRNGVAERVRIHRGPASERLPAIEGEGPFDLVFIDADKTGYPAYLDWAARNLRVGGVALGDNTFAWGMIADEGIADPEDRVTVEALREFNRQAALPPERGGRFRATLLPTGEGLTVAVKVR
jgi:caffeoyl-CoA O-methyltransferase